MGGSREEPQGAQVRMFNMEQAQVLRRDVGREVEGHGEGVTDSFVSESRGRPPSVALPCQPKPQPRGPPRTQGVATVK